MMGSGHPFAAMVSGYEERGLQPGATREAAIAAALEFWEEDIASGWESPGEREVTVYTRPIFCQGDPTGEYRCLCGDSHAGGDPLLSYDDVKVFREVLHG